MRVTINGSDTDLVVETEKNVGELLASIELWLEDQGYSVSGLSINGAPISSDELEQMYALELSTIQQLDIQASSWIELYHQALQEALRLIQKTNGVPFQERVQLLNEWQSTVSMRFIKNRDTELAQFLESSISGQGPLQTDMESILIERIGELEDPLQAARMTHKLLGEIMQRMENLPLDLQTGKDRQAMETLQWFTVIMGKLFRLLPMLNFLDIKTDSFKPFLEEIGSILQELLKAYENKDTVLVGDLAEYEIVPRLGSLQEALEPIFTSP